VPTLDSVVVAWIVVAVVAAVVEISIPHFGLIFVTAAALAAAGVAYAGFGAILQSIIFIVALAVTFFGLRPRMMSNLGSKGVPSRTDTLLGRDGIVTFDIEATVGAGRVNVGGEDWAARAASPIPAGTRIRVVAADGIVLEVVPA
jgi:membrane protein implicated in regulation of membrane protease activity